MSVAYDEALALYDSASVLYDGDAAGYHRLKRLMGKKPVQIVELHLDRCGNTYGSAPCTAAIGVTGTKKCFNTFAGCQDTANFNRQTVIYRFATGRVDGLQQPGEPPVFPTLQGVETAPTVLTPGKGLGVRASVSAKIADHPWTDAFTDPYRSSRSVQGDTVGTFWGKFVARNKYYENRTLVVRTGFLDENDRYDPANFVTRTYVIARISGPDPSGAVVIEGRDPLRLADGEKAKLPVASTAKLAVALTASALDTTVVVTDTGGQVYAQLGGGIPPVGGSTGQVYLRIGSEIVQVTAIVSYVAPTLTLTVVRRSMPLFYATELNQVAEHDNGETVQTTYLWDNLLVSSIVYHLLHTVAGISTAYLPAADWQAGLIAGGFSNLTFSRLITAPTSVKDLLTELTQHGVMIWWDERAAVVRLAGLRFYASLTPTINDSQALIADSVSTTDDVDALATQCWIYHAASWPVADAALLTTYRTITVQVETAQEAAAAYGRPQVQSIRSQWLTPADAGTAASIAALLLRQYSEVRKVITFTMDPKDDGYWVGEVIGVSTRYVQDDEGAAASRNYLITQVQEAWTGSGFVLKYTASEQYAYTRIGAITFDPPSAPPDYSSASTDEKNAWGFISANAAPFFPDATAAYQIQ